MIDHCIGYTTHTTKVTMKDSIKARERLVDDNDTIKTDRTPVYNDESSLLDEKGDRRSNRHQTFEINGKLVSGSYPTCKTCQ